MRRKYIKQVSLILMLASLVGLFFGIRAFGQSEQITIPRIDQMPDFPQPYLMRDWKGVAKGYDSLVYDLTASGEYLPLIWIDNNAVNYPEHERFGLHTVVGTAYPENAEAINVIPSVIGATLCGIDKSGQNGYNYVLMCEEFFNNRPEENIYLNNFIGNSGNDWWYDTMPNIYFFQLAWLYPGTGHFDEQFITVADRWLEAVEAMGGNTTPWEVPYMGYRGWRFSTMTPNAGGVPEPEAAGAIAWILYHAYQQTGNENYRIGAEWCMEYLNSLDSNPAYELQLPYGVYLAAKMNAFLNTRYDVEKLLNWCFTPEGNVRQWGATLGNWGGYDCDGLIGEALYDGYAFFMNGVEQAAALVPMVRYDDRFAKTIGKWVLNLANASRLFYPNYLPEENQDSEEWAYQYDTLSVIAHEAMREFAPFSGISPFATGDAIDGGWGETNLALYGSSHVGYLGAILDTTNVPGILMLNCLSTDFYRGESFPTYLCFNPYDSSREIIIDAGVDVVDIYEAVTNQFLSYAVSGPTAINIPSGEAVLLVLTPSGGTISYDYNHMLVNGVVADYNAGLSIENYPPRIKSLAVNAEQILVGSSATVYCTAEDPDQDGLTYYWVTPQGDTIVSQSSTYDFTAPYFAGEYLLRCLVEDAAGAIAADSLVLHVVTSINHAPRILDLSARRKVIAPGDTTTVTCTASDPDNNPVTYSWFSASGEFSSQNSQTEWTAPASEGDYYIHCLVQDNHGLEAEDSLVIFVRLVDDTLKGKPVVYLPFSGNAADSSGNGYDGIIEGATLTTDRLDNPNSAYLFDGIDDMIYIENNAGLNFRNGITVSFWMKLGGFYNREQYPISHGNWENRWKVSFTPERHFRWTVRTDQGIKDLDTQISFDLNEFRMITCRYDGHDFSVFVDGLQDGSSTFKGKIGVTNFDLTIGQVLPENSSYNFDGVLDEILIYDYPLTDIQIYNLFKATTSVHNNDSQPIAEQFHLCQNYPNPFNNKTLIKFFVPQEVDLTLRILDITGKEVDAYALGKQKPGWQTIRWEAKDLSSGVYFYNISGEGTNETRKCMLIK